jgi:hypothetical protein
MDLMSLAWLATAAVGVGAGATYLLAKWIPAVIMEKSAQHGRFVGLGEPDRAGAPKRRQRQRGALNVVRTAH